MALPILNTPKYSLVLPSTGKEIEFRPFLMKEQKILMLAQQSDSSKMISKSTMDIIKSCTFNAVNEKNPLFDIEYVFLNIRAKSVGETVNLTMTCPDDKKTKVDVAINLEEIEVQITKNHTTDINIGDGIKMIMGYPTIKDIDFSQKEDPDAAFKVIRACVKEIHNGDEISKRSDFSDKELDEFMDSFNNVQFEKTMQFFNTMPKLRHEVVLKNPKTKKSSKVVLEGLDSFF
jgi:hypothetical protein|tara:strand:+ start:12269 stop:12964 length:696 start_codon:yes stop_codon:yes gene_type:complete